MQEAAAPTTASPRLQQIKAYAVWFLLGLLIGVVPLGVRLFQAQRDRDALHQQLQVAQLEMHLASAALMARHGDYTAARDAASQFFSTAQQAADDPDAALSAPQRSHLRAVLSEVFQDLSFLLGAGRLPAPALRPQVAARQQVCRQR